MPQGVLRAMHFYLIYPQRLLDGFKALYLMDDGIWFGRLPDEMCSHIDMPSELATYQIGSLSEVADWDQLLESYGKWISCCALQYNHGDRGTPYGLASLHRRRHS